MIIEVVDIVHRLLEKIKPIAEQFAREEFSKLRAVKDDVRRINEALTSIDAVLLDAQKQDKSNATRIWLQRIQFVAADIEDVLDLISTQKLETTVSGKGILAFFKKVAFDYGMAQKLKGIRGTLDEIQKDKSEFNFQVQTVQSINPFPDEERSVCSAHPSTIFGRQKDKETIISRLVEGDDANGLSVIPIFGISGMGKTTLALQIFNDPVIEERFDLRLWGSASQNFSIYPLIRDLLTNDSRKDYSHLKDLDLEKELGEMLSGRQCLIIIDDLWNLNEKAWKKFVTMLKRFESTVKIVVTTREQDVCSKMYVASDEDCWCIFADHAFKTGEEKFYPNLVKIGKSIAQKCYGIPLVAATAGSFLNVRKGQEVWESVATDFSHIDQGHDMILPSLTLSYNRIPDTLRSCFSQCAVFGKGQPLFRTVVINLWMALRLLDSKGADKDPEDIGAEYFNELLSRSFFQYPGYDVSKKVIVEYGRVFDGSLLWADIVERFETDWRNNLQLVLDTFFQPVEQLFFLEMHDLFYQLATHVSGNEIAVIASDTDDFPDRAVHILCDQEDLSAATWRFSAGKKARSFGFRHSVGRVGESFLKGMISCLECLRILDLSFSEFEHLPDSVGDLKHLRCLKLGWNSKLVGLPDSLCKLLNLQTLELYRCTALEKLPKDIQKLVSLRFLSLSFKLMSLPGGLFALPSLRVLRLAFCENLEYLSDEIGKLKNLRQLEIIRCPRLTRLSSEIRELASLRQLSIFCCTSLDFEGWEGLYGLHRLWYLDMNELPQLKVFPRGLVCATSLRHLRIQRCAVLSDLREGINRCTSLSKLTLSSCPRLTQLPITMCNLKCLKQLNIDQCPGIAGSCVRDGSAWDRVRHIPEIIINGEHIQNQL